MSQAPATSLQDIVGHAKEYGFVFPSSEIYDGLQAVYDYGQNGVELKNNLKAAWWKAMTQLHDNIVVIDAAIFMHPLTWKASGHVDGVEFPKASPRVMHAERTFWEKATAIHVFCLQERLRGDRFARHWHDVVRLDDAGSPTKHSPIGSSPMP